jgi:hypothetical protein
MTLKTLKIVHLGSARTLTQGDIQGKNLEANFTPRVSPM